MVERNPQSHFTQSPPSGSRVFLCNTSLHLSPPAMYGGSHSIKLYGEYTFFFLYEPPAYPVSAHDIHLGQVQSLTYSSSMLHTHAFAPLFFSLG